MHGNICEIKNVKPINCEVIIMIEAYLAGISTQYKGEDTEVRYYFFFESGVEFVPYC